MISEDSLLQYGYAGLFLISFLSATLLPLASEAFVSLMPGLGFNAWLVLIFATTGNFLGALTNYYIGKWGNNIMLSRFIKTDEDKILRAQQYFDRWGTPVLFFSWVPIIGDPLTVVGGLMNISLLKFAIWVFIGKLFRYALLLSIFT